MVIEVPSSATADTNVRVSPSVSRVMLFIHRFLGLCDMEQTFSAFPHFFVQLKTAFSMHKIWLYNFICYVMQLRFLDWRGQDGSLPKWCRERSSRSSHDLILPKLSFSDDVTAEGIQLDTNLLFTSTFPFCPSWSQWKSTMPVFLGFIPFFCL